MARQRCCQYIKFMIYFNIYIYYKEVSTRFSQHLSLSLPAISMTSATYTSYPSNVIKSNIHHNHHLNHISNFLTFSNFSDNTSHPFRKSNIIEASYGNLWQLWQLWHLQKGGCQVLSELSMTQGFSQPGGSFGLETALTSHLQRPQVSDKGL